MHSRLNNDFVRTF